MILPWKSRGVTPAAFYSLVIQSQAGLDSFCPLMGGWQGSSRAYLMADIAAATFGKYDLAKLAICLLSLRFGFLSRKMVVITNTVIQVNTPNAFGIVPGTC